MDRAGAALAADTYAVFKERLAASDCTRCALAEGRTRIVVDRGDAESRVLFVGEAPGEQEDLQGRAFVGRSGKLLDAMLKEEGFDTERDAIIANVVKCRPPKNRAPLPSEAAACRPFLQRQIELADPLVIALLGRTALKHLLPAKKSSAMAGEVGKFFEDPAYPGRKLIVLFHPAYILRDPRKKPLMAEHLRTLTAFWKKNIQNQERTIHEVR